MPWTDDIERRARERERVREAHRDATRTEERRRAAAYRHKVDMVEEMVRKLLMDLADAIWGKPGFVRPKHRITRSANRGLVVWVLSNFTQAEQWTVMLTDETPDGRIPYRFLVNRGYYTKDLSEAELQEALREAALRWLGNAGGSR